MLLEGWTAGTAVLARVSVKEALRVLGEPVDDVEAQFASEP